MKKGKLIVLYGINNLGKSTQAKIIVTKLKQSSKRVSYLKFPLYDLEPSGPMINDYLRKGNPWNLSAREIQILYVMNRSQYDAKLIERLAVGEWIVAEDYIGTGIAWGMGAGVDRRFLENLNKHLFPEDLSILFVGHRFMEAQESDHQHETDARLTEKVRLAHEELADTFGWPRVQANGTIEEVTEEVWHIIKKKFLL